MGRVYQFITNFPPTNRYCRPVISITANSDYPVMVMTRYLKIKLVSYLLATINLGAKI